MLPPTPRERIPLPPATEPPVPAAFPWAATLAPVLMAVGLWAITRSPYSLMFAALGPLAAVGAMVDGRLGRRRALRRDARRAAVLLEGVGRRVRDAQRREGERLLRSVPDVTVPDAGVPGWHALPDGPIPVVIGWGTVATAVELEGDGAPADLSEAAADPRGPLVVDALDGIGVVGATAPALAVARGVVVQVAARLSPAHARLSAPNGESWVDGLPHETARASGVFEWRWLDRVLTVAWAPAGHELPPGCTVRLDLTARALTGPGVAAQHAAIAPSGLSIADAAAAARRLTDRADALGLRAPGAGLPARVALGDLMATAARTGSESGLAAPIGHDADGPVVIDLVADGPHALVAGTTGSGKSELLVAWVLALAHGSTPDELSLLLIDFKGGAAFAPLADLPHVIATLSDLDTRLTRRAIESLRAELLRRERLLADAGVRAIDDLPAGWMPRLVIVVDEFAAVVAASPELHEVFADLAARGRSLGLHLVLCTQRPAGVVRDAVLANVPLRISLRVTDRGDSVAMLGDDAAARLPVEPRGRAIVLRDGRTTTVQIAIATTVDAAAIAASAPPASLARPWCDPLPLDLRLDDLPDRTGQGLAFGLVDLPAEQRRTVAVHDPDRHGHLLVLGASGAGATTTLVTLARSAERCEMPVVVVSADPPGAWAQFGVLASSRFAAAARPLVLIDGLDALLDRFDPDHRHEVTGVLAALLRDGSPTSPAIVATARRLSGPLTGLAGSFGSRLLLRQASADDHVLAGGRHGHHDPDQAPGSATWRGDTIQVARAAAAVLPPSAIPPSPVVRPADHPVLAVIASRPRQYLEAFRASGARVMQLARDADPGAGELLVTASTVPTVLLGDPDAWQTEWNLLTAARRDWPIALLGCTQADHRALLRDPRLPPPLGSDSAECWLSVDGETVRAVLDLVPRTRDSEEISSPNC